VSVVELRSVKKSYGATEVIHGIDLTVDDGEFVAFVGPSGCGKSTLLRMIAGLEEISQGDVLLDGRIVNAERPKARNIAMVFQNYALYPHMTVRENISLNLRISRLPREEIDTRITEAARLLDIEALLDRRPSQLSGGQRQRVAMGRAIVRDPAVFLFDEPLSNLDAKLRVQMRGEIKSLHSKVKTTAIYVTHDQIEAMTLADRVVVLNLGNIEQQGDPVELYTRPANTFVAGFIGSPAMNFLPARVDLATGGASGILADGTRIALPPDAAIAQDQPIVIGIRPEHLLHSATGNSFDVPVIHVEPTGAQTYLQVSLGGRELIAIADGAERHSPGERLKLGVETDRIHIFDEQSGLRLNRD
jgi:multiple sugar transport system ATP-binding protein